MTSPAEFQRAHATITEVACPTCRADVGAYCRTAGGDLAKMAHQARLHARVSQLPPASARPEPRVVTKTQVNRIARHLRMIDHQAEYLRQSQGALESMVLQLRTDLFEMFGDDQLLLGRSYQPRIPNDHQPNRKAPR